MKETQKALQQQGIPDISAKDIPSENITALGRLLFAAASEWFSEPENLRQYENDCCCKPAAS